MDNQPTQPTSSNSAKPSSGRQSSPLKKLTFIVLGLFVLLMIVALIYGLTHKTKTTSSTSNTTNQSSSAGGGDSDNHPGIFYPNTTTNGANYRASSYDNGSYTKTASIVIQNNAFVPQSVTVKSNDAVYITNNDSVSHTIMQNDPNQTDGPQHSSDNNPDLPNNVVLTFGTAVPHVYQKAGTYEFHLLDTPTANFTVYVQ
jgi:plastocyanin